MKDTKYEIIKWADVGCPNCGFNRKIELLCPEDVSQMGVMPAFSICWQCHYVGQIAVGQVSRRTQHALDGGTGCAPEAESTPEDLSAGEVDTHHRQ